VTTTDLRAEARRALCELPEAAGLALPAAASAWRARAASFLSSSRQLRALSDALASVDQARACECAAFAGEDRKLAVLCAGVVEALGGEAIIDLAAAPLPGGGGGPLESTASVAVQLCSHKTLLVATLGAARLPMMEGPLRARITEMWLVEMRHLAVLWPLASELVARLDAAAREGLVLMTEEPVRFDVVAVDLGLSPEPRLDEVLGDVLLPRLQAIGLGRISRAAAA
jgi:hypothetical protein